MAEVEYRKDKAWELCGGYVAERQAMWCDKIEFPDIVETNGVWGNTDPIPLRPEKCFYYMRDKG